MQPSWLRVPRTRRSAIHWLNEDGSVACGRPLDAEQFSEGKAVRDPHAATCGGCCHAYEDREKADFFGRKKAVQPSPPDFGPLFKRKEGAM